MDDQAILDQLFDQQSPQEPFGDPAWYVTHLDNLLHAHDEPTQCEFTRRVLALALNEYDLHLGPPFLEIRDVPTLARLCVGWITVHGGGEVVARLTTELELARADAYEDDPRQQREAQEAQARERDRVFGWADGGGQDWAHADFGMLDRTLNVPATTHERRAGAERMRRRVQERRTGRQGGAWEWEDDFFWYGNGGAEDYGPLDDDEEQFDMDVNEVRVNLEPRARSPRPHGPAPPRDPPAPTQRPRSPGPGEPGYWPAHGVGDHTGAAQQYLDLRLPGTNENVECVICMESLAGAAHLLAGAECLHAFHEECLKAWLRTAPVPGCPTCRREYIPGPPREVAQHRAPQPAQRRGAQAQAPARTAPPAPANGHRTDAQALQRLGFRIEAELDPAAIAARQARAEGERRRRARQGVPPAGRRGR